MIRGGPWPFLLALATIPGMANRSGPQPEVKYCPICKDDLHNVARNKMRSKGYVRIDGTVAEHTHTYECVSCKNRFEINQER